MGFVDLFKEVVEVLLLESELLMQELHLSCGVTEGVPGFEELFLLLVEFRRVLSL